MRNFRNYIVSLLLFAVVLAAVLFAVGETNRQTVQEQKKSLAEAVERSLLQCYVTEGRYPQSISELVEKYGIVYDTAHFRIDYQVFGANMRPSVTIVELEAEN